MAIYLFAKCQSQKNIHFYNSKNIAQNDEQKNGNGDIYPAALSVCDIYIGTHDSFSYTS